ncbi:extracellular calcium-sensing receptor-like [Protopterus annectens]|uniref:extracellular calcium-sensing receptor-like n=1 Tax=Protopterus annectens TaxID=7888 RepID=UPI001CFA19FE|nr:extracellular calcium-sensing receptor-like [Protopterus annectens]
MLCNSYRNTLKEIKHQISTLDQTIKTSSGFSSFIALYTGIGAKVDRLKASIISRKQGKLRRDIASYSAGLAYPIHKVNISDNNTPIEKGDKGNNSGARVDVNIISTAKQTAVSTNPGLVDVDKLPPLPVTPTGPFLVNPTGVIQTLKWQHLYSTMQTACQLKTSNIKAYSKQGDIIIGAIFPVHYVQTSAEFSYTELPKTVPCEIFDIGCYIMIQGMYFAVEEINRKGDLIPNMTLGFKLYDSCEAVARALDSTLQLLSGQQESVPNYQCKRHPMVSAILGDSRSQISMLMARILGIYKYPQISYASSVMALSDKLQFPSFLRTITSDDAQVFGLIQLVRHFGWTWVGILAEGDDYGQLGSQLLREELVAAGVCIEFYETIPMIITQMDMQRLIKVLRKSSAKAVVIFSSNTSLYPVMEDIAANNITGKIWIASDGWSDSQMFSKRIFLKTLQGTIGLIFRGGSMPTFAEFLYCSHPYLTPDDIFLKIFWELIFGCKWTDHGLMETNFNDTEGHIKYCTGAENLHQSPLHFLDISQLTYTYNVYTAVYVIAYALHNLHSCELGQGPFDNGTCANIDYYKPWEIPRSVCTDICPRGFRETPRLGQPICCFDCVPCSEGEISNQSSSVECMKCPAHQWPNGKRDQCIDKSIDFLSYEESLGLILCLIAVLGSLTPAAILAIFVKHRDTPIVKANNRELSYLLLWALVLCFLCSLIFIGSPTSITCMLRQPTFAIIFTLCVSCVLAKTTMVVIAFRASQPNNHLQRLVGPKLPKTMVCICILLQIIICTTWLTTSPPYVEQSSKSPPGIIILQCSEGSAIAFWGVLGYLGVLASVSFLLAFLSRNLPDSFNEAKYITFSMIGFVSVWLSFIPAHLSTGGKYMVAVEIFAILSSSVGVLVCIFFPKCYIVLLHPERNTKTYLMGKG